MSHLGKFNFKKIILLAGLPRTGSTLLSNILAQNKIFHIEGNSALCQLMWDAKQSCDTTAAQQLKGNNKLELVKNNILKSIPNSYYPNTSDKIIIDKCRPWVSLPNMELAKEYIDPNIKTIIAVRPLDKVVASYANILFNNGYKEDVYNKLLSVDDEVIINSFVSTYQAANQKNNNYFFYSYDNLISNTEKVIKNIYKFLDLKVYKHNITKINQTVFENDSFYNLKGMHDIRDTIKIKKNPVVLPEWVKIKCDEMTLALYNKIKENNHGTFC